MNERGPQRPQHQPTKPVECFRWHIKPQPWFKEIKEHRKQIAQVAGVVFVAGAVAGGIAIHHELTKPKITSDPNTT